MDDDGFAPSDDDGFAPSDDEEAALNRRHLRAAGAADAKSDSGDSDDSGYTIYDPDDKDGGAPKQWEGGVKKMNRALSTFHGQEAEYVYEAIDPETDEVFYVGRTNDIYRRCGEHDRRYIKRLRELMKLKNFRFKDVVRRVPELPNGCHPGDVKEMEAFFIFYRKVQYHPEDCPHGFNQKIGDGGINMTQERYKELKSMFAPGGRGYPFPAKTHQEEELKNLYMQKAIAEKTAKMAGEMGEKDVAEMANECVTLATNELDEHMCTRMGLRKYVEHVLDEYEVAEAVDKNALQVQFNAIREKMDSEEKFQVLRRLPKVFSLTLKHPVDHEGEPRTDIPEMVKTPKAACLQFEMLLEYIAQVEELHLEWTNPSVKELMLRARDAYGNEDAPRDADGPDAALLLSNLKKWKANNNQYGGSRTDLGSCNIVMRSVPWWNQFANENEVHEKNLRRLFVLLRAGYGLKGEPHFEGQKGKMSCSVANKPAYDLLYNMIRGMGQRDKARIFAVLDEKNRCPWYESRWNKMVKGKEKKKKKKNSRKRARTSNARGNAGGSGSD